MILAAHHSRRDRHSVHGRLLLEGTGDRMLEGSLFSHWAPGAFGVTLNHIHARPVFPGGTVGLALIGVRRPAVPASRAS